MDKSDKNFTIFSIGSLILIGGLIWAKPPIWVKPPNTTPPNPSFEHVQDSSKRQVNYFLNKIDSLTQVVDSLNQIIRFEEATLEAIRQVESGGDDDVIGDNGKAYGSLQIHDICVREVNRLYGTSFTHQDAFDREKADSIFWYVMDKAYQETGDWDEMIQWWNGGPSIRNNHTLNYLEKVKQNIEV